MRMHWRRWAILAIVLPVYTCFIAWILVALVLLLSDSDELGVMFSPRAWELDQLGDLWILIGVPTVVLVASQAMFLVPIIAGPPSRGALGHPLKVTLVAAGLVAAVLTVGLGYAAVGVIQLAGTSRTGLKPEDVVEVNSDSGWLIGLLGVIVVSWLVWSLALIVFARRHQGRNVLARVIGLLFAGTIIEVLIVVPIDVMLRRRTDCYCVVGSFWSLTLSAWALLWLTGPGIIIGALARRHRLWIETHCASCGYAKGPSPGERCPECGFAWEAAADPERPG